MDAKSLKREKLCRHLKEQLDSKDEQIVELEAQRKHIQQQSLFLRSDIERLQSEIDALKASLFPQLH